ncbi:MAG: hypothetical protein ACTSV1_07810, partial [Alphaproteobacteria bacterium]
MAPADRQLAPLSGRIAGYCHNYWYYAFARPYTRACHILGTDTMTATRALLLTAAIVLLSSKAWALDIGLTPSHVYSLWTNINQTVMTFVRIDVQEPALRNEIDAMEAEEFSGKSPGDVLALASEVEGLWDALRISSDLAPTRQIFISDSSTTPSDVYLESSRILGAAVEWIIMNTDADHLVSGHFVRHEFTGKTPSDVYGLVDLAYRRMHTVIHRKSPRHTERGAQAR